MDSEHDRQYISITTTLQFELDKEAKREMESLAADITKFLPESNEESVNARNLAFTKFPLLAKIFCSSNFLWSRTEEQARIRPYERASLEGGLDPRCRLTLEWDYLQEVSIRSDNVEEKLFEEAKKVQIPKPDRYHDLSDVGTCEVIVGYTEFRLSCAAVRY